MRLPRHHLQNRCVQVARRGYALLTVMLFLSFAFGAWAIFYHTSASAIRVEEARTERDTRSTWTAPAIAQGLRLLESGPPPSDPYSCKVTVASDSDTQYILLTYDQVSTGRYKITAAPTTADDVAASAPTSFLPLPSAPATLTATAASSTQINLTWTDVYYESGYIIQRSANGSSGWAQVGTAAENATNYTDTGLTPSTTYYYRVQGTNVTGNGAYSPTANATTMQTAPAAPTGMTATAVSTSQINLSWNDVATETGYLIERSPDGSSGWSQVTTNPANTTTYSDTSLSAGTTYYYRVRAFNLTGNSAYSSVANATTSVSPPSAPTALIASAVSTTEIDLSWTDNASNETGFKIERSPDGSTWTQINTTAANVASYADTGLSGNTTYYYRVRAYNAGGNSSYTSTSNATTLPSAPSVPSGLGATAASSTEIDLNWTYNSTNETGFKIERSPNGSSWSQINTVGAGVTTYADTGLTASTQYYYRVRAYNSGGNSGYTSSANTTTLVSSPTAPSALGASAINSSEIDIHWTDNSTNETGFKIERSLDNTTWSQITTVGPGVTTFASSGLSASTKYYYRVRAYNAGGNSTYASSANATTTAIPAIPTGLSAAVASSTKVNLSWSDNSNNETGFRIQRSTNNSTWTTVTTTSANVTSYQVTGLTTNTLYYFRIRANGSAGNSASTSSVTATPH